MFSHINWRQTDSIIDSHLLINLTFLSCGLDQYRDQIHWEYYVELPNTKILKKYLIGITLSVQISSKLFDQKYVNLMNFRFYRISLYWVRWFSCHEGVLMSDEDENIMNVGCYSQPASCCTASVLNLPLNISLRYFDWFLLVDHPDYKVLHHILDQCSAS